MQEFVHVHWIDEKNVIEEYRQLGFTLVERTKPTIVAQIGFVKLIFAKVEDVAPIEAPRSSQFYVK